MNTFEAINSSTGRMGASLAHGLVCERCVEVGMHRLFLCLAIAALLACGDDGGGQGEAGEGGASGRTGDGDGDAGDGDGDGDSGSGGNHAGEGGSSGTAGEGGGGSGGIGVDLP